MTQQEAKKSSGCMKKGCLGCAALLFLAVAIPVLLVLVGLITDPGPPEPQSETLARELPALPEAVPSTSAGDTNAPPTLDGRELPSQGLPQLAGDELEPITVRLDLSKGSFQIEPGPPGEPIRIEADYDVKAFLLEESFDPDSRIYRVRFDAQGGWLGLFRGSRGSNNEVRVILPRDYPLEIQGEISMGESVVELGGLWLSRVDLKMGTGDHELSFAEPLRAPIEALDLDGSYGELTVRGLGNASPAYARIDQSAGAVAIDLEGLWRQDAEVDVETGFGECRINAPDQARIEVAKVSFAFAGEKKIAVPPLDEQDPLLSLVRLSVSQRAGEIRVQ